MFVRKDRERGQSMVEVALALPVLLLILSGLLDIGRAYFTYLALEEAAIEAAQFLAFEPGCVDSSDCADPNNALFRARESFATEVADPGTLLRFTPIVPAPPVGTGEEVTVEFEYDYALVTPLIANFFGGTVTLRSSATSIVIDGD